MASLTIVKMSMMPTIDQEASITTDVYLKKERQAASPAIAASGRHRIEPIDPSVELAFILIFR